MPLVVALLWLGLPGRVFKWFVGHIQVTTRYVLQESQNLDHMPLQTWVLEQMDSTGINEQFRDKWVQLPEI